MPDFGTTISVSPDLGLVFKKASGVACLGQDITHRLSTERGGLFYDENYGLDVRNYLGRNLSSRSEIFRIAAEVAAELKKDERIERANVTPTFSQQSKALTLTIQATTAEGPFLFVLAVSSDLVTLTKANPL